MASTPRQKKLEQLIKINKSKKSFSQLKKIVEKICDFDISSVRYIDLGGTEEIKEKFFNKLKFSKTILRENWKRSDYSQILLLLQDIADDVGEIPVVLFSNIDDYMGSVILPARCVLVNADAIWKDLPGDLCIATQDYENGLCLEENFYDMQRNYCAEGVYEMTRWGVFK